MASDKKKLVDETSVWSDDNGNVTSPRGGWRSVYQDFSDSSRMKVNLAFWLFGLLNNFSAVVVLSGAHDISSGHDQGQGNLRDHNVTSNHWTNSHSQQGQNASLNSTQCDRLSCNTHSTGIILMANVVPALLVKLLAPQFLHLLSYNLRICIMTVLTIMGYLLVALVKTTSVSLLGVGLIGATYALGELSFLGMTSYFTSSATSYWSSGTGAAGVAGSWSYVLLRRSLSPRNSQLVCLFVPVLLFIAYWKLIDLPEDGRILVRVKNSKETSTSSSRKSRSEVVYQLSPPHKRPTSPMQLSMRDRFTIIRSMLPYMVPLFLVHLSEYLINQGFYELMIWRTCIFIDPSEQYRWFQALYQFGVFLSRSSAQVCPIRRVWILAVLQMLNVGVLLGEVSEHFLPSIYVIFAIIFYEGLLGGGCYANAFINIYKDANPEHREFSLSTASVADSMGITIAAALAVPVHDHFCKLFTT